MVVKWFVKFPAQILPQPTDGRKPRVEKPIYACKCSFGVEWWDKYRTSTEQVAIKHNDLIHTENADIVKLLMAIGTQEMSVKQMMEAVALKHRPTFLENYLNPAITEGYIRLLYPDSPRHPRQKYLLTVKGMALYNELKMLWF